MKKVENGIYASVDYKGTLENGEVFDTSHGRQPLEVKIGAGQLIKGFENELLGMAINDKKTFTLEPKDAYGERNEKLTQDFARADIPAQMNPVVGMTVGVNNPEGQQMPAQIVHVDDDKIIMDLNHPMAGKTLTFEIEVVGISDTPAPAASECACGCDCSQGSC